MSEHAATTAVAALLGVSTRELQQKINGEWRGDQGPDSGGLRFFLEARWGYAAVVEVYLDGVDADAPRLHIGAPKGRWAGPGTLIFDVGEPSIEMHLAEEPAQTLSVFVVAVNAAYAKRKRSLRICQYCQGQIAPEFRLSSDCCYGCGSKEFGIVY